MRRKASAPSSKSARRNGKTGDGRSDSSAVAPVFKQVIPGRCEASNYDVQLHIGESRDSGSGAYPPSRNDETKKYCRFADRISAVETSHMNHDSYPDDYIRHILNGVKSIAMVG